MHLSNGRWVEECGDVFREQKQSWAHLIPSASNQSAVLAEHFFNTAATLMARQLRDTVRISLTNFVSLLGPYAVSHMNMYIQYVVPPITLSVCSGRQ